MANTEEHLLSVNSYEEPTVLYDNDAAYTLIVRLILLEPGKDPNRPKMGVGLISRYRYTTSDNINQLKQDIKDQIITYLPDLITSDVDIKAYGTTLAFYIKTDKVTYGLKFDSDTNTLSPLTLDDIK